MATATNFPARSVKGNASAPDKIMYVASKLGLTSLKYMQASTRVVYDSNITASDNHTLFEGAAAKNFPLTNLGANGNQFQVNEALLVEKIAFFIPNADGDDFAANTTNGFKFDLIIGNKTVLKDVAVELGGESAFTSTGARLSTTITLEGVGILIPPQIEYKMVIKPYDLAYAASSVNCGAYLFGTGVLLNFNTSI